MIGNAKRMTRFANLIGVATFVLLWGSCKFESGTEATSGEMLLRQAIRELELESRPAERPSLWVGLEPAAPHFGEIYLLGLEASLTEGDPDWRSRFNVYPNDLLSENPEIPPMLGQYDAVDGVIRFDPRFPLDAGRSYRVIFESVLDTVFTVPDQRQSKMNEVVGVYPSVDTLPNNLLKFYIHFSEPMAEGEAYEHLSLIDIASGRPVEAPFVRMEPELWDPNGTRFTLLFDPGRIKRSVALNLDLGPPLQVGARYRLVVDRNWPTAQGDTLRANFIKEFRVVASDREMLRTDQWTVTSPEVLSSHPVTVHFPEPLDRALLGRVFQVFDGAGKQVPGTVEVGPWERQWMFTPSDPWVAGVYELRVETILEDVAGNTLRSPFDVDLQTAPSSEIREAEEFARVQFEVKNP